jgi:hypothetical protein
MALLEGKTPAERNKTIIAIVLGGVALISMSYMLFGGSSAPAKKPGSNSNSPRATASPTPRPPVALTATLPEDDLTGFLRPVVSTNTPPAIPATGRNIFAFYEPPPPPTVNPSAVVEPTAIPTPTPVPPNVMLVSVSPANVYARTGDFTLEVTGDKFTPELRIQINETEIPTRFINAQQLSANVSGSLISFEGPRQITVRSSDGQFFSNAATLNVQAPPTPNYIFVGLLGKARYNDTALLKDKGNRELLNVQRGDILGGRFRVTSISEREVVLTDTNLKIKHQLALTTDSSGGPQAAPNNVPNSGFPNPNQRYTPPPQGEEEGEEP